MDDRRAALLLSVLALTGASVRYVIAPSAAAPGDVALAAVDTPPRGGLQTTARAAARLARPREERRLEAETRDRYLYWTNHFFSGASYT